MVTENIQGNSEDIYEQAAVKTLAGFCRGYLDIWWDIWRISGDSILNSRLDDCESATRSYPDYPLVLWFLQDDARNEYAVPGLPRYGFDDDSVILSLAKDLG